MRKSIKSWEKTANDCLCCLDILYCGGCCACIAICIVSWATRLWGLTPYLLSHAVEGWSVVEFQGHSLNKWVSYMSTWVPAAGLGGGSRATPSVSTILPVQSESAQVPLFPRAFSLAAQQYEQGRVIFLNSSLSPNCYWEG